MSNAPPAENACQPAPRRLLSLDALRGFDMFWIVGGEGIVHGLTALTGWWLLAGMQKQLTHVPWNGFTAYDLIFPLFLFIAGVTLPFSIGRALDQQQPRWRLALKIIRRGLLLVLLGLIYNGLLNMGFSHQLRWGSVLGRIGLAWMLGALIYLVTDVRGQIAAIIVLLVGYWGAMMFVPVPGGAAGVIEPGKTLADFVDRRLMPGTLYIHTKSGESIRDPEGLFSTIPAIATALLGALTGTWLRRKPVEERHIDGVHKTAGLLLGMAGCLLLGWLWSRPWFPWHFPLNKNLWSSSFVLWTAGWSLFLLAMFYYLIDVWQLRRWAFFFVVIGANAITIYLAVRFIDFGGVSKLLVPPSRGVINEHTRPILIMAIQWMCLWLMYRGRLFLRV